MNLKNSRNGYSHDGSTINIDTVFIIKPHRTTTYVDAVYCYRPNSVV